ncbi:MAG TPA: 50S ribosomal protein L23 [Myxococcota bacterium]|nr:50S ribosomal protein L23 [Myxococcota bacterium]HNZ02611.1 50S ribosomal protein L23 [Myxococcota bacterium]HOD08182.1 50S ribosomal protein L23 [Myxococcota bacterium]HPB50321.1 50S ribosomal protein L23 [Myxococcota bacterium]HQP95873.1 50S ribosomal protein L23 [Myxococcota bacterium]
MKSPFDVIRRPIITEKANVDKERRNTYHFEVPLKVGRQEIREAVEAVFQVKVEAVRTSIVRGKQKRVGRHVGRRPDWKKAIVTLREGDTIDLFEGV